jgi:hypothetical protein
MQRGPRKHYSLSGKSHDQFRDPAHRAVELDLTSSSWFHVPAAKNRVSVVSQVVNRMKKHSHAHTHAQKEKKEFQDAYPVISLTLHALTDTCIQ